MKNFIKPFLVIFLVIFVLSPSYSQRWKILRFEASVGLGSCNIFGDIGGSATEANLFGLKDIRINSSRPSIIGGIRYKLDENMAVKFNLNFCMGGGTDAGSKHAEELRNYKFISFLSEQSLQFEYYLLSEDKIRRSNALYTRSGMMNNYSKLGVYLFGGIGGAFYAAKVSGTSPTPYLETLAKPGYTLAAPIGVGAKLVWSDRWSFNAELGYRYTLSDGLDGLTSKFSKANDIYWMTTITACYRIKTNRNGYPDFLYRWFLPKPGR
jgi:hypothetical protein